MEYRKLISFGKSSYVVSLPKAWVDKNNLKKGAVIYFDEGEDGLLLSPKEVSAKEEEKEITIQVDGKPVKQIKREVIAAYIKNYRSIVLLGDSIKDRAKEIQDAIQSLVALEVLEQTTKKIVAKDFLRIDEIVPETLIRKMDIIIRAMIEDCKNVFQDQAVCDSIDHRDNDVNKLTYLLYRVIRYGLENSGYAQKKLGLNATSLHHYWWMAYDFESIADEVKRIARYMGQIKFDKKTQEEFKKFFMFIEKNYLDIAKGYYTANPELSHSVLNQREQILEGCNQFYIKNKQTMWIGFLMNHMKSLAMSIHHLGRLVHQR